MIEARGLEIARTVTQLGDRRQTITTFVDQLDRAVVRSG